MIIYTEKGVRVCAAFFYTSNAHMQYTPDALRKPSNLINKIKITGRKQTGLLLTLGVRSCSFESGLPEK